MHPSMPRRAARLRPLAIVLVAAALSAVPKDVQAGRGALVVPIHHATIQAAIDAAEPRRTIEVRAGTYFEQLVITKDLRIVGAGMDATVLRAPATLVPGALGSPAIVEIRDGASVAMSGLTVAGPGSVACGAVDEDGNEIPRLRWGIRVHGEAHLDLGFAAVRDIQDTPMAQCPRSGAGITVGQAQPGTPPATADIHHSEVTGYQTSGVVVLGSGSRANVTHCVVAGPGHEGGVPTDGIELVAGAVGTIAHNRVSGNVCPDGFDEDCGPDFFTQLQHAGIVAGGNGPGTVIEHNVVFENQIGLYLAEVDAIRRNVLADNDDFGIGLIGTSGEPFVITGGSVTGGGGGVWAVAVFADVTVVLDRVAFSGLSGPAVEVLECCGFTATVVGGP